MGKARERNFNFLFFLEKEKKEKQEFNNKIIPFVNFFLSRNGNEK